MVVLFGRIRDAYSRLAFGGPGEDTGIGCLVSGAFEKGTKMHKRVANLALVLGLAGACAALSVGCGSDDDSSTTPKGGAGGASGHAGSAGKGGSAGKSGAAQGGGSAGEAGPAGSAGVDQGGASGAGGDQGETAGSSAAGEGGEGGAAPVHVYTADQVERGKVIVRSQALCGGCHTATDAGSLELGGNAKFASSTLPAPNLTDDAAGIGEWTDAQVIYAFRNGIDDEGKQLASAMPYWLFHNMNDADALSVVAFLRSLPHSSVAVPPPTAPTPPTAVTPLAPSSFPETSLPSTDPAYAEAQRGKYLVSGVAQCVKCHSPADAARIPIQDFFSGVPPANNTTIFPSNLTPDATGLENWTAGDVATALKAGTNKAARTLCGSMPSAAKGYGGMTDADAHAIGVYLTTIPPISKAAAAPGLEPACPVTP